MNNRFEQEDLEEKFSKQYASKLVIEYFSNHEGNKVIGLLCKELSKLSYVEEPMQTIAGFLCTISMLGRASFQAVMAKHEYDFEGGSKEDCLAKAAVVLGYIEASGLVTVSQSTKMFELKFVTLNFELPEYIQKIIGNTAYLPPAVIPSPPTSNSNAGWYTFKKSIFLSNNHHEGNAPLEWLSVLNSVPFSIDINMLNYDEDPDICLETEITNAEHTLHRPLYPYERNNIGREVAKKLENFQGRRSLTIRTIKEMLGHRNEFYFIHRFCARYRAYAAGYALSPQGNDYRKALLNLHKTETLKEEYNF